MAIVRKMQATRAKLVAFGLCSALLLATPAAAATHQYDVLIDADSNSATGCSVSTSAGAAAGVEIIVRATVNTTISTATVSSLQRLNCVSDSTFSAPTALPGAPYTLQLGQGSGGSTAVEMSLALSAIPANVNPSLPTLVRLAADTSADALLPLTALQVRAGVAVPTQNAVPVPSLRFSALLALAVALSLLGAWLIRRYGSAALRGSAMALLGVAVGGALLVSSGGIAYAINNDGAVGDWAGTSPLITGAVGNAPANADLRALYAKVDGSDIALRIDADVRLESLVANTAPVVNAGSNQTVTLNANGTVLANLAGSVSDDGLPAPANLTSLWSVVSGPGLPVPVTLGTPATPTSQVGFAAPGTYVLRLTANDGALSTSRDVTFTVNAAANAAPTLINPGNRTMTLGSTLKLTFATNDPNVRDALTYSLPTAPAGAQMNPGGSAHLQFAPTATGVFNFTARVADQNGLSDQKSFTVTVVSGNRAPQLTQPTNATVAAGAAFSRALIATDPDGDVLTYQLISGPSGMTVSGANVLWTPTLAQLGQHTVKLSARDPSGAFDAKMFTVTVTSNVAPTAKDDTYSVKLGESLTVNAANGVLKNDADADGNALTAIKLTNPDKGTLTTFNTDGSFSYAAPASLPPVPGLNPVVSWRGIQGGSTVYQHAADFDHDGKADFVSSDFGNLRAWRGSDGSQLWQFDSSITTNVDLTGCQFFAFGGEFALGDVTGGGEIDLIMPIACTKDAGAPTDRYFAINGSAISPSGKVAARWLSDRLSVPHPGAYATPTSTALTDPPSTYPFGSVSGGAYQSIPTLAKLTAGGATKILFHTAILSSIGGYYDQPNSGHIAYAGCRLATGIAADEGRSCKITYILDAATGAIEHKLVAPNTNEDFRIDYGPTYNNPPIISDLDGDGQVEIIAGGEVWKLVNGNWSLAWQATFLNNAGNMVANEPDSVAVADLDGDGKAEVVMHVMPTSNSGVQQTGGIYIYRHDGVLLRKIRFDFGFGQSGLISIADVDGDGVPEILLTATGSLFVYRADGSLMWATGVPDILADVLPVIGPISGTSTTNDSPVYVYDLDLDGKPEVIFQGTRRLFIFDGRTGEIRWSVDTESSASHIFGNPHIVDADGDGHVDILVNVRNRWNCSVLTGGPVECKGGTFKISGGSNNWAPGPKVQNQLNFRASAINDAGVIRYDGSVRRDFRQQIQQGTVTDPRIAQSARFTYAANDGAADSAPATVIIDIQPPNRPPVITSTPPTAFAEIGPAGELKTIYTITAADPDPGDSVHYEFVSVQGNLYFSVLPTVDSVTGAVNLLVCGAPCGERAILIVVAAVDSFGARTEQSMVINVTPTLAVVPNVIGQTRAAASTQLEAAALTPLLFSEVFSSEAAGIVIAQDPLAGAANIAQRGTVRLTVSKGPAPVLVPNVIALSEAIATSRMNSAGFTVTVNRAFSLTVPRGEVLAQLPAAGTTVSPTNATLTVSSGSGLEVRLAQGAVVAGASLGFTVLAFNADGSSATPPPVTFSIAPRGTALGTLPTASGNQILTSANALGGFDLIATETGGAGRVARTTFAVLLAPTGPRSPQKPIADLLQVLSQMEQQRQTLDAARAANDNALMRTTLGAMVATWKSWQHNTLAQTPLLITPTRLPMTPTQLEAAGRLRTADDALDRAALEALTQAMRDVVAVYDGSAVISINAVRAALTNAAAAAKPLEVTTPSVYGAVNNLDHTTYLATRALPQSLSLLMREVSRTLAALPSTTASANNDHNKAFSGSLAELSATTSIHMDLAKDYYGPIIWKVVASGAALAGQSLLRDAGITGETALSGMVTGASLSFHIFEAPGTFIEQVGASDLPEETQVWILGPSAIAAAIEQIRGLIKGFSAFKDLSGLNSRLAASSAAEAQALLSDDFTKITSGFKDFSEQIYAATNVVAEWPGIAAKGQGFFLAGNQVERGCIFDGNPYCKQVFFGGGFPAAEKCDPRSFCVPLALLVITWTPSTMAFGADAFPFIPKYEIACAKDPVLGISLPGVPPGCVSD